ncbi:conserved protein of unknown function [Tenacibaculum sp. 190524A02b]|uniref:hypothetical protein n=1 Tax=Tenacibaculum vairaonense TaxID=3137860 RepID=UPI0032B14DC1
MDNYVVGSKKPIKLKIEVQSEAIPTTYTYLEDTGQENGKPDIPPFNPSIKTGWKLIDKGGTVNGKTLKVATFLRFFNSFPNEETFNLAIKQIKDTYKVFLTGGDAPNYSVTFTVESLYSSKVCIINSEVTLS